MTPSTITDGQINKAVANYRALLEKYRAELMSEPAQQVLGQSEFANEMFGLLRQRVELLSKQIARQANVDRARSPEAMLKATGRKQYVADPVVSAMPRGEGEEVEVIFFKPEAEEYDHEGWMSDEELDLAFKRRGLKPADPYSLAAVNEADPAFADERPHGTHWKDAEGYWCFAAFGRWLDERRVSVNRNGDDWVDGWWFAGVRK